MRQACHWRGQMHLNKNKTQHSVNSTHDMNGHTVAIILQWVQPVIFLLPECKLDKNSLLKFMEQI